jgi:thymidylate kinase
MIIILEGPDGAGKSTLAEKLRAIISKSTASMVHMVKHGPYSGLNSEQLCKLYFRAMSPALTFDDTLIMDRSWLSEPIYADAYRGGNSRVDMPRRRMLERIALARGAVVVLCQPAYEVCEQAFSARLGEEYLDNTTQLRQVYAAYDALALQTHLTVVHYDYVNDDIEDLFAKIKYASIANKSTGGGSFKQNNYLMLCDKGPQMNVKSSAVVVPFINFLDNDGPSRMLAAVLEDEGVPESCLYWANTQNAAGAPSDASFIQQLAPRKIFALGNNAYAWALNNNVKAIKLPPPLYHIQNYPDQPYHITEGNNGFSDYQ